MGFISKKLGFIGGQFENPLHALSQNAPFFQEKKCLAPNSPFPWTKGNPSETKESVRETKLNFL